MENAERDVILPGMSGKKELLSIDFRSVPPWDFSFTTYPSFEQANNLNSKRCA
jgi:hypothetical protein